MPKITFWRGVGAVTVAAGLYATVLRFGSGLGASTNLSDGFPWGIWIGFDILVGVGLAAGGFTITAAVHLFDLKRYEPIVRPTILTAFLGYLLVIVGLLFDLGQPHRVWHPLIMWNGHSAMFEIGWCVTLYTTVLFLEFSPMLLERLRWQRLLKVVRAISIPVVIMGVLLSTLHQSSLGTLFVIVPNKLHGLWYSPLLPVFFFFSAVGAGLSMVIIESALSSRAFGRQLELPILSELARVIPVVLALYLTVKLQDMIGRGTLHLITEPGPESYLFLVETVFGIIAPMILFFVPAVRRDGASLVSAALLVVLGFVLGRLNVSLTGMQRATGVSYFPAWSELAVTGMLVTMGFVLFSLAVKYLKVLPKHEPALAMAPPPVPSAGARWLTRGTLGALAVVMLYGAVALDGTAVASPAMAPGADPVVEAPPAEPAGGGLRLPDDILYPALDMGTVVFSHESHVDVDAPSCATCHAGAFSIVRSDAAPAPKLRGEETMHAACGACHNDEDAFGIDVGCMDCHQE